MQIFNIIDNDAFFNIIEPIFTNKYVLSVLIIIACVIVYKIIYHILLKSENFKGKSIDSKKGKTYLRLFRSIIRYVVIIIAIILVLRVNGVNVSSLLAGVGIAGVVIGLAIQDWLKDIIRGLSIISDSYFQVGDIVQYKDIEGKVIVIGLKSTKIQELKSNNIVSIANRNIEEIHVVSNLLYVTIPMPYKVKLDKAEKAIDDIIELVKKQENVNDCKYVGVNELGDSSINYYILLDINQRYKLQVRRDTLRNILIGLDKNGIEVPFKQIDIHNKD